MNELYLAHHGILGQKWGVRRFQNKDGTRTALGKKQEMYRRRVIRNQNTKDDVNDILSTFSKTDYERFDIDPEEEYVSFEMGAALAKRIIVRDGDMPVAFFDIFEDRQGVNVAIGARSGEDYRGKGYATKAAKQGMGWYERNKERFDGKTVTWGVRTDNEASIRIAKKMGFVEDPMSLSKDGQWINYNKSDRVAFVSGSSKTQSKDSGYYRKQLPKEIKGQLDNYMSNGVKVVVGDAPGIDRQVQNYLKKKGYDNVEVYGPGTQVRYSANKKWKTNPIDAPEYEVGSKEWLAKKDIEMERVSTEGLAVVLDEGAKATRKNVERLIANNKSVKVYELSKDGRKKDRWQ